MAQGLGQCLIQFAAVCNPDPQPSTTCREVGENRVDEIGLPDIPGSGALLFRDLPQLFVVQEDVGDVHSVFCSRRELGHVLSETSIPRNGDDLSTVERCAFLLSRSPGPEGGGKGEPRFGC